MAERHVDMLSILGHQRSASQKNSENPPYTCMNGQDKKTVMTNYAREDVG